MPGVRGLYLKIEFSHTWHACELRGDARGGGRCTLPVQAKCFIILLYKYVKMGIIFKGISASLQKEAHSFYKNN